ncbi:neurexin-4-like [Dendronephthya gigantea]|uniref:neurexin-4-like n=1 Tax=Dendronephthya gigantea TaxID=151771 RepID=UPI00106BDD4B|nr:neurexin-4-like [Dendronephthya gigantea]
MAVLRGISALIFISGILQPGDCSFAQAVFSKTTGKYLANHVIETKHAETELECSMHCLEHGSCMSANYKISGNGKGRCELNSKTIQDTSDDDGSCSNPEFKHLHIINKIPANPNPTESFQASKNSSSGILRNTYNSCTVLRTKDPSADSGIYSLKPQGLNLSVSVFCNMTSKNSIGVTEIGHDSESRTFVKGYGSPGSYNRSINYEIPMEVIVAIIQQSKNCEQFIKYECYHSVIWFKTTKVHYGWWVSRQGSKMNYWGGAAIDSGECACGMNNSCAGGWKCNCNKNDETWREDSGYLTDKNTLPVTELRFGDTVKEVADIEEGYHTLGKLRCWG